MNNVADPLSIREFHAYLDSQLTDTEFSDVEARLEDKPSVVLQLQQCMMINEAVMEEFGDVIVEPLPGFEDDFIEGFEHYSKQHPETVPQEPISILDSTANLQDDVEPAMNALDAIEIDTDFAPKQTQEIHHGQGYPQQQSGEDAENADNQTSFSATAENIDNIDMENLMKGISEVDQVDDARRPTLQPLQSAHFPMDLYEEPDRGWLHQLIRNFVFAIKLRLSNSVHAIVQRVKPRRRREDTSVEYDAHLAVAEGFDLDIDHAIEDTPKWQFIKDNVSHATDDAFSTVKEQFEPIKPRFPWIAALQQRFPVLQEFTLSHSLYQRRSWALAGIIVGIAVTVAWNSGPQRLDKSIFEKQAIESHLYFTDKGYSSIIAGKRGFNESLAWLHQKTGSKLPSFSISESQFQHVGATLLPSVVGYSSLQIFENKQKERMSLYIAPWDDETMGTKLRCEVGDGVDGICVWKKNALLYILVADLSLSRVRKFAENLAARSR